jgi:nitrogen regulatory protein PII
MDLTTMKKITAYINTVRVHWLVEELEAMGIKEIMVTEYFSPSSKISRMELLAQDEDLSQVRDIIHRIGTTGEPGDHSLFIEEFDPTLPGQIPLGKRTSKLEESRVKQLINYLLRGTHTRITAAFLLVTLSVLGVALFIEFQTVVFRESAEETTETMMLLLQATSAAERAVLEEMLAVERFHRGEALPAFDDFHSARRRLTNALSGLKAIQTVNQVSVDSLISLEHRFHLMAGGMFALVDSLSRYGKINPPNMTVGLFQTHNSMMSSLDALRQSLFALLTSLEFDTRYTTEQKRQEMRGLIDKVRISLLLLVAGVIAVTVTIWLLIERRVSRPIQMLVEEAKTIDVSRLQ